VGALAGERILDACAAPGGKTSYIAALVQNNARIVATDSNMIRLKETEQNLNRLGVVCVEFRLGDVTNRPFVLSLGTFDRILVDAPCSNLGVLRHNPEVKYRIREQDLGFFSQTQLRILKIVSNALRPGGKLVYSVCTTSREETTRVVTEFLEKSPEYEIEPIKDHEVHSIGFVGGDGFMRTFPPTGQKLVDGFFAARVMKSRKMCE
jgi:16S rRNA (cytosine967-C5)-methyltransferase